MMRQISFIIAFWKQNRFNFNRFSAKQDITLTTMCLTLCRTGDARPSRRNTRGFRISSNQVLKVMSIFFHTGSSTFIVSLIVCGTGSEFPYGSKLCEVSHSLICNHADSRLGAPAPFQFFIVYLVGIITSLLQMHFVYFCSQACELIPSRASQVHSPEAPAGRTTCADLSRDPVRARSPRGVGTS